MKLGLWPLLERAFGRGGILAYHGVGERPHTPAMHVAPERLRSQLEFVQAHYTVVPLRELIERWRAGRGTDGLVAITFDDAYVGVARHALPLLAALDLPATIFVTSAHAAVGAEYWWDTVERARLAAAPERWFAHLKSVGLPESIGHAAGAMDGLRTRVLADFAGRWPGSLVPSTDADWRSLRFDEMTSLAADARVEFGVHTLSHPSLPALAYGDQVKEMRDNFHSLAQRLPRVLPIVAYPYGLYDRTTIRAAREAGMSSGVTMEGRAPGARPELFTLPRVGVGDIHRNASMMMRLTRAMRPVLVARNRGIHPRVPLAGA